MPRRTRPDWWDWEIELADHIVDRMRDRGFDEVDLRGMLQDTTDLLPARRPGRWIARTTLHGRSWTLIVEPDLAARILVVITAYSTELDSR